METRIDPPFFRALPSVRSSRALSRNANELDVEQCTPLGWTRCAATDETIGATGNLSAYLIGSAYGLSRVDDRQAQPHQKSIKGEQDEKGISDSCCRNSSRHCWCRRISGG